VILVFGSINVDLSTRAPSIPLAGETVKGTGYTLSPGGKGANQALAAARAGGRVALVGAVGDDAFAKPALALLREGRVDVSGVVRVAAPTGAAFITLDPAGRNAITVASGANGLASAAWLGDAALGEGDTLLVQRELPDAETLAAMRLAKARGARVILNAAPSEGVEADLIEAADIVVMNEHEAFDVAEALGASIERPEEAARRIDADLGRTAIVTLGEQGAAGWSGGGRRAAPAPVVEVVDTTGAGDAFCGALAAALERGWGLGLAMQFAVAAGSLACLRPGAQASIPHGAEIEALMRTAFAPGA